MDNIEALILQLDQALFYEEENRRAFNYSNSKDISGETFYRLHQVTKEAVKEIFNSK